LITLFDEFIPTKPTSLNDRTSYHNKRTTCLKIVKNIFSCIPSDKKRKYTFFSEVFKLFPYIIHTNSTLVDEMDHDASDISLFRREIKSLPSENLSESDEKRKNELLRKIDPIQKYSKICYSQKINLLSILISFISNIEADVLTNTITTSSDLVWT
jgi:hypothetical protein